MLNIGLIGFGTVGAGVVELLQQNSDIITSKTGISLNIVKIADSDLKRTRSVHVDACLLTTNVSDITTDPSIDVVIEAVGGIEPAYSFVCAALQNGKAVVTSNKELIAKKGADLEALAKKNNTVILFEGAVGGGIPIINQLRMSLAGNDIEDIYGIVNGTTNYILTKMTEEGKEFSDVLKEAQKLGYAEANPENDIEGYDASYKAAILASVAYGASVKWEDIHFEGISKITLEDIEYAKDMGYKIKLLAVAKKTRSGLDIRVHPTLIPAGHPLAAVGNVFNAICVSGNAVGDVMFYGRGAGALPTASAVISDVVEIGLLGKTRYCEEKKEMSLLGSGLSESRYYIRLKTFDEPGVLAQVACAFGDHDVSINSVLQKETVANMATVVIITHKVKTQNLRMAIEQISKIASVPEVGNVIRVGME